jgi:hypothetical protein
VTGKDSRRRINVTERTVHEAGASLQVMPLSADRIGNLLIPLVISSLLMVSKTERIVVNCKLYIPKHMSGLALSKKTEHQTA